MPDGKAYDLLVNPKAIIYDTRASKAINLSDLSVGNIAVVVAKRTEQITLRFCLIKTKTSAG